MKITNSGPRPPQFCGQCNRRIELMQESEPVRAAILPHRQMVRDALCPSDRRAFDRWSEDYGEWFRVYIGMTVKAAQESECEEVAV